MKSKLYHLLFIFILTQNLLAQSPQLIIRGDDMGYTHSANEGLLKSYIDGIMTTVEVMPVTPWFLEAVEICNKNENLDVGIHIALTSEWENLKWRPITSGSSIIDNDGYFYPKIFQSPGFADKSLITKNWKIEEIEAEIRAQIEVVKEKIPHVSHVSAHMNWDNMDPKIGRLLKDLAIEYALNIDPKDHDVISLKYNGNHTTAEEKIFVFKKMLKSLENGKTYLFLDHPAIDNSEQQAVSHLGYENVSIDRNGVIQMLINKDIKKMIKELGIELITYKDLLDTKG